MRGSTCLKSCLASALFLLSGQVSGDGFGTGFTYQGQLKEEGRPVNNSVDFQFTLWDADGNQVGGQIGVTIDSVVNGLFTALLDFGADPYTANDARWLEIAVRSPSGQGKFVTLAPRQRLTPTPFSLGTRGIIVGTNGNVGIGTPNPNARLHIVGGSGTPGVTIESPSEAGIYVRGSGGSGMIIDDAGSNGLLVREPDSTGLVIRDTGHFGVEIDNTVSVGIDISNAGSSGIDIRGAGQFGIRVTNAGREAGYFDGDVQITGDLDIDGNLSKGGGSFRIDHPLDPENKYFYHSFVESPDMMNVYNGNIGLDQRGEGAVGLPEWFEALNRDFRYQLTAIGASGPNLYIAEEIKDNRFKIAGGQPGLKVSWQVTGIRQDAWANANRIQVEVDKPNHERGKYLHPEAHGIPEEMGVRYAPLKGKLSRLEGTKPSANTED